MDIELLRKKIEAQKKKEKRRNRILIILGLSIYLIYGYGIIVFNSGSYKEKRLKQVQELEQKMVENMLELNRKGDVVFNDNGPCMLKYANALKDSSKYDVTIYEATQDDPAMIILKDNKRTTTVYSLTAGFDSQLSFCEQTTMIITDSLEQQKQLEKLNTHDERIGKLIWFSITKDEYPIKMRVKAHYEDDKLIIKWRREY